MAENLNSDSSEEQTELKQFWGLSHLLMLGMVQRFHHNVKRYRPDATDDTRAADLFNDTLYKVYVYRNTLSTEPSEHPSGESVHFKGTRLVLGQKIYHQLYRIHHRLLDYEASFIDAIIPVLDRQLRFWDPGGQDPVFLEATFDEVDQQLKHMQEVEPYITGLTSE